MKLWQLLKDIDDGKATQGYVMDAKNDRFTIETDPVFKYSRIIFQYKDDDRHTTIKSMIPMNGWTGDQDEK